MTKVCLATASFFVSDELEESDDDEECLFGWPPWSGHSYKAASMFDMYSKAEESNDEDCLLGRPLWSGAAEFGGQSWKRLQLASILVCGDYDRMRFGSKS